ncbi:MAG: PorT family protein, partial [Paramuribaculum sp.]|nr:PorT family protein [Paramuribaculum sp.]
YVRLSAEIKGQPIDQREYIEIPLNLKWKINVPVVASIVKPFLTTGPSFSILTSKENFREFKNKKTDVAWNFGFGVELIKHIQVSASYGIGMTKAFESVGLTNGSQNIDAKNRYWTVTAAYLF